MYVMGKDLKFYNIYQSSLWLIGLMISISLQTLSGQADLDKCGQQWIDSLNNSKYTHEPIAVFERIMEEKTSSISGIQFRSTFDIPVIVHVIHNGESVGTGTNISYEQVLSQLEVLNEDFQKLPGSNGYNTHPDGAAIGISFCVAAIDEEGNILEEPGVNRIDAGRSSWSVDDIEEDLKPTTIWSPNNYFNIWVVNIANSNRRRSGTLLGYAQFPTFSTLDDLPNNISGALTDGVVIDYQSFGSSEKGNFSTLQTPNNLGRVATHEIGHWLGLRHIWGDGNCFFDDYCEDTPYSDDANYNCALGHVSCGSEDQVQNYMDYSDDACMNLFTNDQKNRIITVLENSPRRRELLGSNTCVRPITEDWLASQMSIFPNPVGSTLSINYSGDLSYPINYQLYNLTGQLLQSVTSQDATTAINVDLLPQGFYLVTASIEALDVRKTFKVIKE